MEKTPSSARVFLRCTCGESVNIRIYTAGYNSAPLLSALFSSSCLWLVPVSALGIFLSPVLLITLFHPPFPFLHYEILISSSLSFGHGPWIMHLSLSPDLHLLTRFPSLLPAAARVSQRRSDKIRPLTLLFVFTLAPLSLLRPVVVSLLPVCSARRTQSGILWFFMWREWSRGWLGGCGEALIKALVCLNAFLLSL